MRSFPVAVSVLRYLILGCFSFRPRSEIRRSKLCPPPLKKRGKLNRSPSRCHRETRRGLDVLSASLLTQNLAGCTLSSTSVALSCSPRHRVSREVTQTLLCLCVGVRILMVVDILFCLPMQSWQSWRCSWKSRVQQAPSPVLLTASWRTVNGSVTPLPYERHHCVCCLRVSSTSEKLKFWLFLTEPAPASLGSAEARGGLAVWWTSLLPQHRRGKAAAGVSNCRWDTSQTGITTDM